MPDNKNVAALLEQAIGRRAEPDRLSGWTVELVIEQGLGRHVRVGGSQYVLRLDGRAAGPVFFVLTPTSSNAGRQSARASAWMPAS